MKKVKKNNSVILSALSRFSEYIYSKIKTSFICGFFTNENKKSENGFLFRTAKKLKFSKRVSIPLKRFFAKHFDKSIILNKINSAMSFAPSISLKTVGLSMFVFGLISVFTSLIRAALKDHTLIFSYDLGLSIAVALIGGILSMSSKNCAAAVTESKIVSFFLFKLIGIKAPSQKQLERHIGKSYIGILCGVGLGALSVLLSPLITLVLILSVLYIYTVMCTPECGVTSLFLLLPFLSVTHAAVLCAFTAFSWFIKVIRGKRTFHFRKTDVGILAFAFSIFFGGIISVTQESSMAASRLLLTMLIGYYAVVSLIKTAELLKRCVSCLTFSFSVLLTCSTLGYGIGFFKDISAITVFDNIPKSFISLLSYNSELTLICVPMLVFLVYGLYVSKTEEKKATCVLLILASVLCLFVTRSSNGIAAVLIALLVLTMLLKANSFAAIFALVAALPVTVSLLPQKAVLYLKDFFGITEQPISIVSDIFKTTNSLISDSFAGGIGLGDEAFKQVYPLYSASLSDSFSYSHSLYT